MSKIIEKERKNKNKFINYVELVFVVTTSAYSKGDLYFPAATNPDILEISATK